MAKSKNIEEPVVNSKGKSFPAGRQKITAALKSLMEEKDFNDITTSEIASTAGVTEALIYRYFKDKRDLLYEVLAEFMDYFYDQSSLILKGIKGSTNKLRKLIWHHINACDTNRVFTKISLEVRSYTDYYGSKPHDMVKIYSQIIHEIIEEGVRDGELRDDLSVSFMKQVIIGAIDQFCSTAVMLNGELNPDELSDNLCSFISKGIEKTPKEQD
jgi:TetR/AcrR family fatty acid metabolism transcriptional regulator